MIDLTVAFAVLAALGLLGRRWPRWEALGLAARPWARFARYAALADGARSTAAGFAFFRATEGLSDRAAATLALALRMAPLPEAAALDVILWAALLLLGRRPGWARDGAWRAMTGTVWAARLPVPAAWRRAFIGLILGMREFFLRYLPPEFLNLECSSSPGVYPLVDVLADDDEEPSTALAVWSAGLEPFVRRMAALATAKEWRLFLERATGRLELGEAASLAGAFASAVVSAFLPTEALALLVTVMVSVSCSLRASTDWRIPFSLDLILPSLMLFPLFFSVWTSSPSSSERRRRRRRRVAPMRRPPWRRRRRRER